MNNSGKLALARAIVAALPNLTEDAQIDLVFTSLIELDAAVRKSAAGAIALAEESLKLGKVSLDTGEKLGAITRANGAPVLAIVEALAGLEDAARLAAASLDGRELFGQAMSSERVSAILALREALARVTLARHKPAAAPEGDEHAAAH